MKLRRHVASGALWTTLEAGGGEALSLVVFVILARLVAPEDFGLIALAGVFVGLIQLFLVQGFAEAVIQRERLDDGHLAAAFWANAALGLGLTLATLALAGPIAVLLGAPALADVLRGLSPIFLCSGLAGLLTALVKRRFAFKGLAVRALVAVSLGGAAGIGLALAGAGVWSLVAQQLVNNLAGLAVLWWWTGWRPRLSFSRPELAEMTRFAGSVAGGAILGYAVRRADYLLLGHLRPVDEVGQYFLAHRLVLTVGLLTFSSLNAVLLPVLSRLQSEPDRFRDRCYVIFRLAGAVCLPLVWGLGLVAAPLIDGLFGAAWRPAARVLEIVSGFGLVLGVIMLSAPILIAFGRPAAHFRLTAQLVALFLVLYAAAAPFGLDAMALAFLVGNLLSLPLHLRAMRQVVGLDPWRILREQIETVIAGLAMAGAVVAVRMALSTADPLLVLLAGIAAGGAAYLLVLALIAPAIRAEALSLVRAMAAR